MGSLARVFHRLACRQRVLSGGIGCRGARKTTSVLNDWPGSGGEHGGSFPLENSAEERGGMRGTAPFHGGFTRSFFTLQKSGAQYPTNPIRDAEQPQTETREPDWLLALLAAALGTGFGCFFVSDRWASEVDKKYKNYSKWAIHSTELMVEHNSRLELVEELARGLDERLQFLESSLAGGAGDSPDVGREADSSSNPASLAGIESRLAKLEGECQALRNSSQSLPEIHPMSLGTYHGTGLDNPREAPSVHQHLPEKLPHVPSKPPDFSIPAPEAVSQSSADVAPGGGAPAPESIYLTRNAIADAAAKAGPAVVNISSTGRWGILAYQNEGSGFIVEADGTIITNAHVVIPNNARVGAENNNELMVTLEDGRTYEGVVVSYDTLSDLAVVKIQTPTPLPTVRLGNSSSLRPGDWVLALGSPHNLPHTVTAGIISCVDRKSSEMGLTGIRSDYLQTDAAVNQGNSGGPLVNLDGEVIGINTMKLRGTDGVSFAIPIDTAVKVLNQLKKYGRVRQPFVGIKMLELNSQISTQLKERHPDFPDVDAGILIAQVIPGSPAARAGIANGDIITEFDGSAVTKVKQVLDILGDRVGERITFKVRRQANKELTVVITTEEARGDV